MLVSSLRAIGVKPEVQFVPRVDISESQTGLNMFGSTTYLIRLMARFRFNAK